MSLDKKFLGKKCIFRTYSAGVHYGTLVARSGKECVLENSIRIWRWEGACSLSQLAMDGTCKPGDCKFAIVVDDLLLTEVVEIIICTHKAIQSIESVKTWKV